jgi:hypothetical protein|tara:strand:- start:33 stop:392 length:360 start_codon:yes stop_codon:yes gene_type:complete
MATPNLVNITSINGFNICGAVTTSGTDVIDVPADKIYKVNTILIANVDGTNAADITVQISRDNGSNYFHIAKTISVPADSTLSLLNTTLYLDETDLLKVTASANSDLEYVISGEILDDA